MSGGEKKKVKEKERAQSRFILSTNFIWNIVVRSSRLSPKGQKLLQLCPVDKVEEKLLESCLCSEKESVLTVRAVLQECPGQGLRTRGDEGQEGNLGSGGQRQPPYWELHSSHGTRVTGCLEAMAAPTSRCLSPAATLAAGEPPSPALPRWLTGSLVPGPRREQTGSLGTGPGWNHLWHSRSDWPCCLLAAGLRQVACV